MCGVCGIAAPGGGLDSAQASHHVRAMVDALAHRGPDDSGLHGTRAAVLGATRLAIRGLADGRQPMVDAGSGVVVVCNGEIDNHASLRAWLAARGRPVASATDVAVIPGLYLELGDSFVERLAGVFAVAIWDPRESRLLLARDRAGERPLFYCQANGMVRFATEIAALSVDPSLELTPDRSALARYVRFGYFTAPETPFAEVHKVAPGEVVVVEQGRVTRRRYWRWAITTTSETGPDGRRVRRGLPGGRAAPVRRGGRVRRVPERRAGFLPRRGGREEPGAPPAAPRLHAALRGDLLRRGGPCRADRPAPRARLDRRRRHAGGAAGGHPGAHPRRGRAARRPGLGAHGAARAPRVAGREARAGRRGRGRAVRRVSHLRGRHPGRALHAPPRIGARRASGAGRPVAAQRPEGDPLLPAQALRGRRRAQGRGSAPALDVERLAGAPGAAGHRARLVGRSRRGRDGPRRPASESTWRPRWRRGS